MNCVGIAFEERWWTDVNIVVKGKQMSRPMTKPAKWHMRPVKTKISVGIRPVWSESSLSVRRKLGSLATQWAHSEDSDQTARMSRLVWIFAGRTVILWGLSWGGSNGWMLPQHRAHFSDVNDVDQELLDMIYQWRFHVSPKLQFWTYLYHRHGIRKCQVSVINKIYAK